LLGEGDGDGAGGAGLPEPVNGVLPEIAGGIASDGNAATSSAAGMSPRESGFLTASFPPG
jgi:hypothetical protein